MPLSVHFKGIGNRTCSKKQPRDSLSLKVHYIAVNKQGVTCQDLSEFIFEISFSTSFCLKWTQSRLIFYQRLKTLMTVL